MAYTSWDEMIIPSELRDRTQIDMAKLLDFMFRGAAVRENVGPGEFVNVRGFNELTGSDVVMSKGGVYDVESINQFEDISPVCRRIKVYGAEDLAKIASGADPMGAIARQISNYFSNVMGAALLNSLVGIFATGGPLNLTNLHDKYNNTTPVYLTPAVGAVAMAKIGDNMDSLGVIFMHSGTYATLLAAGYLETNQNLSAYGITNDGSIKTFMGKPVLVSDKCPLTVGTGTYPNEYISYFCALGSLGFGIQKDVNPETGRDAKNKLDYISTDVHFAPHVNGIKWNVTTTNPTNAQLATATNWALTYSDAKFVKVVAIRHN